MGPLLVWETGEWGEVTREGVEESPRNEYSTLDHTPNTVVDIGLSPQLRLSGT